MSLSALARRIAEEPRLLPDHLGPAHDLHGNPVQSLLLQGGLGYLASLDPAVRAAVIFGATSWRRCP